MLAVGSSKSEQKDRIVQSIFVNFAARLVLFIRIIYHDIVPSAERRCDRKDD